MRKTSLAAVVALTLGACAGEQGAPGTTGASALLRTSDEAAGDDCASGGVKVDTGIDDDRDGTLDDAEVDGTVYACDGASVVPSLADPGAPCEHGGVRLTPDVGTPTFVCNGPPGADGQSVTVTPAAVGGACEHGGQQLQVGGGTPTYVCNGAPGEIGPAGESVAMTPEDPGPSCEHGGQRLQIGAGEPAYVCNGAPGQDGESVTMTPEPPGPRCLFGGVALRVGAGPAEYVCSGAPVGVTLATVTTDLVTDVRYVEAVVTANVTDDGGELVLLRGVVLATHPTPTVRDLVYFSASAASAFATVCDGLAPEATYFVRAFATNTLGTAYGDERSFTTLALTIPTLGTAAVSNVTLATALSGGTITDDGGSEIVGRGICWSTAADPTTADSCAAEGVGAGSFVALATGLSSATTYHLRGYATNAQGTGYGEDLTFTTATEPLATVTTAAATSVSYTSVTLSGTVVSDAGAPVTSRGVCWSTSTGPTTAGSKFAEAAGLGAFGASVSGLSASTTYYARAFAVNAGGTSYGNEVTFRTLAPAMPVLSTRPLVGVSSYTAGSGGVVATDGGLPITAKGICWGLTPGCVATGTNKTNDGTGAASFNSVIGGLNPLTTYTVRAYATNALGTAYGNEVSFTTTNLVTPGPTEPVVGTSAATIATGTTATGGGYVSGDGGSAVTARGLCWSTSQNPTRADACSTDGGTGTGFYSSTVTGLSGCGVVYYVRAYATNATGTGYGNQVTVSTGLLPTVATEPVTAIGYYGATSGGAVTDTGGCAITQKGVAWSWTQSPTVSNSRTTDGTGGAPFVSSITGLFGNRTYYVRAYATNSVGTTYGPQQVFSTLEPPTPYVGQSHAGGIVFYLDGTGVHGLVAASTDQGSFAWGCNGVNIATDTAVGTGAVNTAALVALCADANTAAKIADALVLNGYSDWFLPSIDELALMAANLGAQGTGGFAASMYLSSSQVDGTYAWGAVPPYPYTRVDWASKYWGGQVRAVRAF